MPGLLRCCGSGGGRHGKSRNRTTGHHEGQDTRTSSHGTTLGVTREYRIRSRLGPV